MRKIREIMRLKWELGLGLREIARSISASHSTVLGLIHRAEAAKLSWPLPAELDDDQLEQLLYPGDPGPDKQRPEPDCKQLHRELRRKGVTLQLLWLEYKQTHPDGYQYSQFCAIYNRWRDKLDVVIRQTYPPGERTMVDYAGMTVPVLDRSTGEIRQAQVFVGVLAASNYLYAEGTWTQGMRDWIGSHCRMFEFFRGVTKVLVNDNLKSGVTRSSRYEPALNPTYEELCRLRDYADRRIGMLCQQASYGGQHHRERHNYIACRNLLLWSVLLRRGRKLMPKVWESRVPGPLAPYTDGFRSDLARLRYSPGGTEYQMWVMAQLSRWLVAQGLEVTDLTADRVEQFLAVQRRRKGRRLATERSLRPLFGYLRDQDVLLPPANSKSMTQADELLERYRRYLTEQRDLAPRTVVL